MTYNQVQKFLGLLIEVFAPPHPPPSPETNAVKTIACHRVCSNGLLNIVFAGRGEIGNKKPKFMGGVRISQNEKDALNTKSLVIFALDWSPRPAPLGKISESEDMIYYILGYPWKCFPEENIHFQSPKTRFTAF